MSKIENDLTVIHGEIDGRFHNDSTEGISVKMQVQAYVGTQAPTSRREPPAVPRISTGGALAERLKSAARWRSADVLRRWSSTSKEGRIVASRSPLTLPWILNVICQSPASMVSVRSTAAGMRTLTFGPEELRPGLTSAFAKCLQEGWLTGGLQDLGRDGKFLLEQRLQRREQGEAVEASISHPIHVT